ncbi:hypothetical protein [Imhoffiella purpurea]|uniref:Uncharacterized protein n=1 Tax=Imhoffiella purpurea TaxID=1249627 RepID=W9VHC0_9GAMM|nr:hypothetical protein [Imhoffiella purpurea]EXJ15442.1 hypothetical protein D779_1406 [Imhoffiella purpurea]
MSSKIGTIKLDRETIIQLQALTLPGESLASVIQRAALALQTIGNGPDQDGMSRRMEALESRLDRIERCCGAYHDRIESDQRQTQASAFDGQAFRMRRNTL